AVVGGVLGAILSRRRLGLCLRRGPGRGSARRRCVILVLRRRFDRGGLLLLFLWLRFGGRLRAWRRRLGAGIDEDRLALLLQRRSALGFSRAQAREEDRVGGFRIVIGDEIVLILGGRSLAVPPAHFVAQVGRCGGDGLHRFHRAEGRHEPGGP